MSASIPYAELRTKSAKELRDICVVESLDTSGRKLDVLSRLVDHFDAQQRVSDNFVTCALGPTSAIFQEYRKLPKFHRIKDGWSKDIREVPEFDLAKLKKYLIESNNKSYDQGSLRAYKALQAYKHYWGGHVHSLEFNQFPSSQNFCFLRGKCNPSQDTSGKQYMVYLCMLKTGDVLGAHCQCVAGLGEACTHAAGLMFALEDFVAKGYRTLPDGKTCTDILCYWTAPRSSHVEPRRVSEIDFSNSVFGKEKQKSDETKPLSILKRRRERNEEEYNSRVADLRRKLQESIPSCDFLTHFKIPRTDSAMPEEVDHEEVVVTSPMPLASISTNAKTGPQPCSPSPQLEFSQQATESEQKEIEKATRGQANNPLWFQQKTGRITASMCKDVYTFGSRTQNADRLLKAIMRTSRPFQTLATCYGIQNEALAVEKYEALKSVKTVESGLVVDLEHGEIACSPDRFVFDPITGEHGLVEVKCLYSCRDKTVEEAIEANSSKSDFPFCFSDTGICLKAKHKYFFQVQMQLGITRKPWCDVVVFTNAQCDVGIQRVQFDENHWHKVKAKLLDFHAAHVRPVLLKQHKLKLN